MILVTGASGLLGANLLLQARDGGREVVGLCHSQPLSVPSVPMYARDLTNFSDVRAVITTLRPAAIIHCAAATAVDWCENHPIETEKINAEAAGLLAGVAKELNAKFVYVSTDSVFDGARGNYSESDLPCPLNVYATSKLNGERATLRENPDALVVRVNIYGWNAQEKQSLSEWILGQLLARREVPGFTDVIFSPLLVNDLADALLRMVDLQLSGTYHVTGSQAISKFEFARMLARIFGADDALIAPARVADSKLRAPRPRNTSLNTQKLQLALGMPMPGVEAGLRRFKNLQETGYVQRLRDCVSEAVECQT
jgi:dTDP-4-dehydrorhamnose reductase